MRRSFRTSAWSSTFFASIILALAVFAAGATVKAETPPGPIRLEVDASRAPQKILHARLQIPVHPGPLVLYYPKWIPGEHMPDGPIANVAGLKFTAGGKTLAWNRDLVDMCTFRLDVPAGVNSLEVTLDFLLSAPNSGFSAGASATPFLDVINWNQLVLYPKGYTAADLTYVPSLRLPEGWKFGTALPAAKKDGDTIHFAPVQLNTLVDSPVLAGLYFRAIELTPGQNPSHEMDIAADSAAALDMPADLERSFRKLVEQTGPLFGGARHYRDYRFLLTLSDDAAHFGLEHHESSDDRTYERSLIDPNQRIYFSDLLPHEFVHSWNGKYRRPADLATPDYQTPMKDDLLWVYEGLTEYYGEVLTARAGFWSGQQAREALAHVAAQASHRPGREWASLQDTADAAPLLYNADLDWSNWRRSMDFYQEGELLWLDVDTTLRRLTHDQKSMNDFCRLFYGGPGGKPALKTYTFEDIVAALNSLAPHNWTEFLRTRLDSMAPATPVESVENSGWRIVYNETPNEMEEVIGAVKHRVDLTLSMGLLLSDGGFVLDVIHDGPSYNAGIGPGMKITAVNGKQYSPEVLKEAITAAKSSSTAIQLMVANGSQYQTHSVDYHGGLRYPHLERDDSRPDYLSEIFHPMEP
ncbi:MAG: M61 family metallopeptidase [Deltaproteobacteria bacterium]